MFSPDSSPLTLNQWRSDDLVSVDAQLSDRNYPDNLLPTSEIFNFSGTPMEESSNLLTKLEQPQDFFPFVPEYSESPEALIQDTSRFLDGNHIPIKHEKVTTNHLNLSTKFKCPAVGCDADFFWSHNLKSEFDICYNLLLFKHISSTSPLSLLCFSLDHIESHFESEFLCDRCGKVFVNLSVWRRHQQSCILRI